MSIRIKVLKNSLNFVYYALNYLILEINVMLKLSYDK